MMNVHILHISKRYQRIIFTIFFLVFIHHTYSQNPEPIYRRYNVDNGLPSSNVYHVFQDSKGYMWFATANGVSRFNGYKFQNFDLNDGLVDNDVFEIYEDYKGRIWFIPISGKLAYYENGKIISYKYNYKIKENVISKRGPVKCSFYVDSLDYVYLSIKHFGKISISPEGIYKKYSGVYESGDLYAEELDNGKIFITSPPYSQPSTITYTGKNQKFQFTDFELFGKYAASYHMFFLNRPDSSLIFLTKGEAFNVKNGIIKKRRKISNLDAIWFSVDESNILWAAPFEGGVIGFKNSDISNEPQFNFLKPYYVSSVLKDREGSYWFTTLNDGVFYCPNINFLTLSSLSGLADDRINALYSNKEGLYVGYNNKYVDFINDNSISQIIREDQPLLLNNISKFYEDTIIQRLWVCSAFFLHSISSNKPTEQSHKAYNIYPRDILKSKSGGYWIGNNKGLVKFDGENTIYQSYDNNEFSGLIYSLVEDSKGDVWFCTMNGLWKYSRGNYLYLGTDHPLLAQNGSSLIFNPIDSCLWFGTNGLGIVVYSKDSIFQISRDQGLVSNSINSLYYHSNEIWAATSQGLSRITINQRNYEIKNFTIADGLPTNETTSVTIRNNTVFVGTQKGLCLFNLYISEVNKFSPNVIITDFKVNNRLIDSLKDGLNLKYYQNLVSFDFIGFVYKNEGKIHYKYRMLGLDTTWVHTYNPNCMFSGLSNGNYTFEVLAQSNNGVWSNKPTSISFTILPPIWKRTWFLIIGTLFFSTILFFVYKIRVNTINRRNELVQNINQYKQQSLRQQMNPHFIFNTLNSIQLYILEKDPISSHKYLTKFARLMRMTLDNSLSSTITLNDELEALKIYLELEKLRLEGKFTYNIDYGNNKSILNYKIPTLLIQPFVENAIWHGIMLKEDQSGWVKVDLVEKESIIECTITDNGVGRELANSIRMSKNKDHKSRGTQITQQRIDLLNSMYQEKFNIRYEDLYSSNNSPMGTIVHLSIPKDITMNNKLDLT